MIKVLACDPGFANFGYSVWEKNDDWKVVETGVLKTSKKDGKFSSVSEELVARTQKLTENFRNVLDKHEIVGILIEMPTGGSKSASALKHMMLAAGVAIVSAKIRGIPLFFTSPQAVKKGLFGSNATKDEMMQKAHELYGLDLSNKPKNQLEHIADSIGVFHVLKHKADFFCETL